MKGSRVQISDSALKIKRLHFDATSFSCRTLLTNRKRRKPPLSVLSDRQTTKTRQSANKALRSSRGQLPGIPQQPEERPARGSHAASPCCRGIKRPRMQKVPTPRNPPPHFPHKSPLRSASTGAREHRARNPHPEDQPRKYRDSAPTRRSRPDPADWLQPARSSKRCSAGRVLRCPGGPNSSE